jgi:hypothetical protein
VLRIWDLKRDWNDGYQQGQGQNGVGANGGYVGRGGNGYTGQGDEWLLETRSVLTSVRTVLFRKEAFYRCATWSDSVGAERPEQIPLTQSTANNIVRMEQHIARAHRLLFHRYHCHVMGH